MSPIDAPGLHRADFGPLVVETDVDAAVIATLRAWLPQYLTEVEDERDLPNRTIARPAPESFANVLEDEEYSDHRLPAVLVTTAQTVGAPAKNGDGEYYAAWRTTVSVVVRGETKHQARAVAALFGGSVRRILVQHDDLDGFAGEADWARGFLLPVRDPTESNRFLAAGVNEFDIYIDRVLSKAAGPVGPPDPDPDTPYDDLAEVGLVTTTVEGLPIQGDEG